MPIGRAAGKERGREQDAEHVAPLDFRHQEPEAIERVGHVLAAEAQHQHRHRRVADAGERLEPVAARKVEIDLVEQCAARRTPPRRTAPPAWNAAPTVHPLGPERSWVDRRREPDLGVELARERVGQLLQAVAERDHAAGHRRARRVGVPLPRAHHAAERLDDRAVGALEPVQLRQRVPDRELLGVAGVDAGDERVGDVVQDFLVEPAADEGRDALLHRRVAGVDQRLAEHAPAWRRWRAAAW